MSIYTMYIEIKMKHFVEPKGQKVRKAMKREGHIALSEGVGHGSNSKLISPDMSMSAISIDLSRYFENSMCICYETGTA